MTDNPPPEKDPKRSEADWTQAFTQLEQLGVNVAQWLTQFGIGTDADLQQVTLSEPMSTCKRATVRLDMTLGKARISALPADSSNIFEADITSVGAVEMSARTEGESKSIRLRQKRNTDDIFKPVKDAVDSIARIDELNWNVRLSPSLPLALEISAGLTIDEFDFSGLQLTRLKMDGGTGHTIVKLAAGVTNTTIEGGVGILDLHIPDGAKATLAMDAGAGATNLTIGEASLKAEIDGGVGNFTLHVVPGAAIRLRADSGLGNINVPERIKPVEFESEFISESGVWESAGFEFAANKIDIRYEGGVGSLIITEAHKDDSNAEDTAS